MKKNKIIVRVCVGCIIPKDAKLIGQGQYKRIEHGQKISEPFYDYEIREKQFANFYKINYIQLLKYNLIDKETKEKKDDDKKPVKESSIRGYSTDMKKK